MVTFAPPVSREAERADTRQSATSRHAEVLQLDARTATGAIGLLAALVIGLGVLREIVLQAIGSETMLQDLRHFAFDAEHSLPAWFETLAMAAASGLLALIAALAPRNDPENRNHWILLAVIFLLMSADEAVAFHEVTMAPLRQALGLSGVLYFSWVVIAAPILLALAAIYIPFLLRLPSALKARFIVSGALFVGGAFGLELVGGYFVSVAGFEYLPYKITAACEESLEIAGITLFVAALFQHLASLQPVLRIAFSRR